MSKNLVVVGQGYVGLPMALRAAEKSFSVVGLDNNPAIVDQLNAGVSHIDDVADDQLKAGLRGGYTSSSDPSCIASADVVVVCVPTPLSADGGPDLGPVVSAARAIGEHVARGTLVVLESTTYPGTTEEVFAPLVLASGLQAGVDVHIAFSRSGSILGTRSSVSRTRQRWWVASHLSARELRATSTQSSSTPLSRPKAQGKPRWPS